MREHVRQRINEAVYNIYQSFDQIRFPMDLPNVITLFPNCRIMTYETLAVVSGETHDEIIKTCESFDGCTKYSPATGHYLILVNDSSCNSRCAGRIRWTIAHELGHIICGHFTELTSVRTGEMQSSEIDNKEMEEEADFFAASLLAPLPALCRIGVRDIHDIKTGFGLSQTAAERRWIEFKDYLYNSTTTVFTQKQSLWKLFRDRGIVSPIPYHFDRTQKLPRIKPVYIPYPDTDF